MARGSVFRKNGGWAFRVDAGFHAETGKHRQLLRQGFSTKRAAEEALAEAVGVATRGMAVSRSTVKVGEYLDDCSPPPGPRCDRPRPAGTSSRSGG